MRKKNQHIIQIHHYLHHQQKEPFKLSFLAFKISKQGASIIFKNHGHFKYQNMSALQNLNQTIHLIYFKTNLLRCFHLNCHQFKLLPSTVCRVIALVFSFLKQIFNNSCWLLPIAQLYAVQGCFFIFASSFNSVIVYTSTETATKILIEYSRATNEFNK